ncbi:MAG: iron ABC transporter permease [bacterium]|uniref:Iron(III) ABC transporter, permease protein n=1 Tax=candidate division TA06 bacterium 34_109 TaxID=1635277 RepID=A0A101I4P9_UNCT6|nr:MAG: Iron(III) ABC transporter, permease protein [candidate division TA06 bacterium 32_111]KUK88243.1 MAG: Iron(III) ABC transporter, permease protein [candidate division TA06 bacterium 34_109]MDI6701045.1 iron ABC transporter permease [bacterium]
MKGKKLLIFLTFFLLTSFIYIDFKLSSFENDVKIEIIKLRIFRYLLVILSGMVLTSSGAVMQVLFKNPLLDPYVLGISGGGLFGFLLSSILFKGNLLISIFFSFFFSVLSALLSLSFSSNIKSDRKVSILISGLLVNILFSSFVILLSMFSKRDITFLFYALMGSFNHVFISKNLFLYISFFVTVILSTVFIIFKSKELDIMSIDEDIASTSGVNVKSNFFLILLIIIYQTSVIVSFVGMVGFVGIIIPNILRMAGILKNRDLILGSFLGGASLILVADFISKYSFSFEIPIGVVLSIFSLPFIFWIVKNNFE